MYVDNANSEPGMINPYGLLNVGATYKWGGLNVPPNIAFNATAIYPITEY